MYHTVMTESSFTPAEHTHRRFDPLTGRWILVSPGRLARPWQGQIDTDHEDVVPPYDPTCPLCPGNNRADSNENPKYQGTYVFDNDFAALKSDSAQPIGLDQASGDQLFRQEAAAGTARVICFSPAHDKSLPELPLELIRGVIDTWIHEIEALSQEFVWVQVFENKGAMMGSSQPHPHGQIWASNFIPTEIATRDKHLKEYLDRHGSNLLNDYVSREIDAGERVVVETEYWVALVPYWAAWPFETMLLPKQHTPRFDNLTDAQKRDLALALKELLTRYDNLFHFPFPYSMGWHYAPYGGSGDHWQLNAVFYPPLLRSATVRKFMVGYEMLAEVQRDMTPEQAAERLQTVSSVHYKQA